MADTNATFFAPQLYIPDGVNDISFYKDAFGAEELRRWTNDDGTIHVAELVIDGAVFHLHQATPEKRRHAPGPAGTTVVVGIFVPDVDKVMNDAGKAGATIISPAKSYEYGYRQGEVADPFGHHWLIQTKI